MVAPSWPRSDSATMLMSWPPRPSCRSRISRVRSLASAAARARSSSRAKLAFSRSSASRTRYELAGKAVDLVQRAREPPGQAGADRDQHRRIGQAREEDALVGHDLEHRQHVVDPAYQHDGYRAAEREACRV